MSSNSKPRKKAKNTNIKSPCVNICNLDENGTCVGCKRTKEEIANWLTMKDSERESIMAREVIIDTLIEEIYESGQYPIMSRNQSYSHNHSVTPTSNNWSSMCGYHVTSGFYTIMIQMMVSSFYTGQGEAEFRVINARSKIMLSSANTIVNNQTAMSFHMSFVVDGPLDFILQYRSTNGQSVHLNNLTLCCV